MLSLTNTTRAAAGAFALLLTALPVSAAVSMNLLGITTTTLTFSFSGEVIGAFDGDFPALNRNRLYIEETSNADWITTPDDLFPYAINLSGQPLDFHNYDFGRAFSSDPTIGDFLFLQFDVTTSIAGNMGTDTPITLTLTDGAEFVPGAAQELVLSWGVVDSNNDPFIGIFQSVASVPEPSYVIFGGLGSLLLVAGRRRHG